MESKFFRIFLKFMKYLLQQRIIKDRTFFNIVGRVGIFLANTPEQLTMIEKFIEGGNRIIGKTRSN